MAEELIYINADYRITKKGNIFRLSYFDECISESKDRHKEVTKSRVTKNYEFIKMYMK
ncbi:MAG: hypothetical protein ACRCX2_14375 [Paraclostridium sp.]